MGKTISGGSTLIRPIVKVLYAPGNNCHYETMDAFKLAGANPSIYHLTTDLIDKKEKLSDCDILAIPGGFSFGDHLSAGRIFAIELIACLKDQLLEVKEKQIPIIGICNGFQILMNTGLLPGNDEIGKPQAILDRNYSGVFESRWVTLYIQKTNCIWTNGIKTESLRMPVAHGEGRLLLPPTYNENQTVLRYGSSGGTENYPANPNRSAQGRAAICDPTGLILGIMPHPERAIYSWLGSEDGLKIFIAGVEAVK
jgi:phosphoribosylformylglycinamidine synthase